MVIRCCDENGQMKTRTDMAEFAAKTTGFCVQVDLLPISGVEQDRSLEGTVTAIHDKEEQPRDVGAPYCALLVQLFARTPADGGVRILDGHLAQQKYVQKINTNIGRSANFVYCYGPFRYLFL